MLAVKLHKRKQLWLGRGAFLVPIVSWGVGRLQVYNWIKTLDRHNRGAPNDCIRYISLVRIPDDHVISLHPDWVYSHTGSYNFRPVKDIPAKLKRRIAQWWDSPCVEDQGPDCPTPELVLGVALPASCVLWTKDVRLLYHRHQKPKRSHERQFEV